MTVLFLAIRVLHVLLAAVWIGSTVFIAFQRVMFSGWIPEPFQFHLTGVALLIPQVMMNTTAGVFMYLMPVFGSILGMVFLGERFELYHALGMGLIFAGVATASRAERR